MKLLADENIDQTIVKCLMEDGHKIWHIAEMKKGISDDEVLDIANQHNALLLTIDKDFGELVFRKKLLMSGVLLIRLGGLPNSEKAKIVSAVVKKYGEELYNTFSVITSKSIRIRKDDFN